VSEYLGPEIPTDDDSLVWVWDAEISDYVLEWR
jgi:hypothetical protein